MQTSNEINFLKILQLLLRRLWLIILLVIISGSAIFTYSKFFVEPSYTATMKMYITDESQTTEAYYDPTKAYKLVNSCLVILRSKTVLSQVTEQVQLHYTVAEITKMISVSSIEDTEFFTVNVTNTNPQHAKIIADALAAIAPDEINRFYETGSAKVLDEPDLPVYPTSPNIKINTIIGSLVGLLIALFIIFAIEMLSTTIKTEQDLIDRFNLPVLGSIPSFEGAGKSQMSRYQKKHERYYSS